MATTTYAPAAASERRRLWLEMAPPDDTWSHGSSKEDLASRCLAVCVRHDERLAHVAFSYAAALNIFEKVAARNLELNREQEKLRLKFAEKLFELAPILPHLGEGAPERVRQALNDAVIDIDKSAEIASDEEAIKTLIEDACVKTLMHQAERIAADEVLQQHRISSPHISIVPDPPPAIEQVCDDLIAAAEITENFYAGLPEKIRRKLGVCATVRISQRDEGKRVLIDGKTFMENDQAFDARELSFETKGLVRLLLPKRLNQYNSFSLVYVAAHEFAVHLFECLEDGPRTFTPQDWSFSEGFVDAAVKSAVLDHINETNEQEETAQARRMSIEERYDIRPSEPQSSAEKMEWKWRRDLPIGRRAFEGLVVLAEEAKDHPHFKRALEGLEPEVWARRAVARFNLLGLTEEARATLVEGLETALVNPKMVSKQLRGKVIRQSRPRPLVQEALWLGHAAILNYNVQDFVIAFNTKHLKRMQKT